MNKKKLNEERYQQYAAECIFHDMPHSKKDWNNIKSPSCH